MHAMGLATLPLPLSLHPITFSHPLPLSLPQTFFRTLYIVTYFASLQMQAVARGFAVRPPHRDV